MAALNFNVPPAALATLDAYAQRRNYVDFHDLAREWIRNSVRNARREERELSAANTLAQNPADPVIT